MDGRQSTAGTPEEVGYRRRDRRRYNAADCRKFPISDSFESSSMIDVAPIIQLQKDCVARWHREPVDNPYHGFLQLVCTQHQFNYLLWHEEDIARSKDVSDAKIAEVKRAIDGFNQRRNDGIEKLDDALIQELGRLRVDCPAQAPLNTETPGSAIDRLSILALRLYHMQEQVDRTDASAEHRAKVQRRLVILHQQHADLSNSLAELLADIFAGRKRLRVYRQFKMYNDPTLNPYLYGQANAEK